MMRADIPYTGHYRAGAQIGPKRKLTNSHGFEDGVTVPEQEEQDECNDDDCKEGCE